jgi:copper resistance protein B
MQEIKIMRIKILLAIGLLNSFLLQPAFAADEHNGEHGGAIYHAFTLETEYGGSDNGTVAGWDIEGWIGGDYNKLAIKSEGEYEDDSLGSTEFWGMYSRNAAPFWDFQVGLRHDTQPTSTTYAVLGFEGLAPQFFETEAHLFLSDEGDVTARVRQENDFLVTQRLILQPYAELNLSAQDVEEQEIGAGFVDGEIGLQTRYEITRKFAPYVDVRYERKFGETSSIAKSNGEDNDNFVASAGLRLMF